jgi:hypothetical protein
MQQVRNMPGGAVAGEGNRAYETEPANWKPLENRIGSRCAEFMWMFRQNGLEYYKHIDTPRYLILDQKGRCYCRTGDRLGPDGLSQAFSTRYQGDLQCGLSGSARWARYVRFYLPPHTACQRGAGWRFSWLDWFCGGHRL